MKLMTVTLQCTYKRASEVLYGRVCGGAAAREGARVAWTCMGPAHEAICTLICGAEGALKLEWQQGATLPGQLQVLPQPLPVTPLVAWHM